MSTIITGLLSFMNDSAPTLGSITSSDAEKKVLARRSKAFNLKVTAKFLKRFLKVRLGTSLEGEFYYVSLSHLAVWICPSREGTNIE